MSPEQQAAFQDAADVAIEWSTSEHLKRKGDLAGSFREKGLEIDTPDVGAFRTNAQQKYLGSDLAKDRPEGMPERINAI